MMAPYLKLSEIKHYYCQVMESLNAEFLSVNAACFKERLLQKNANLEATPHNNEVFISFKDDLAAALKYAEENDARSNLNHILQTSRVQQQFKDYVESRIIHHKIPVSNTITKNKFHIFTKPKKDLSKTQKQLKSMKNNVGLFSRLFIACQTRNGDLDTFFAHENQAIPPSLSENGSLKLPKKKSEIVQCLECDKDVTESPDVDAKIIDGAAIINMLRPSTGKTFQDYANNTFIPFIAHLLKNVKRLDLVWDRYFDDSLKICTRDKRGAGVRRKVSGNGVLPNNWQTFLRCSSCFHFYPNFWSVTFRRS